MMLILPLSKHIALKWSVRAGEITPVVGELQAKNGQSQFLIGCTNFGSYISRNDSFWCTFAHTKLALVTPMVE